MKTTKTRRYSLCIMHYALCITLVSCATADFAPRHISAFTHTATLPVSQLYDKVCYTDTDNTFFCLSRDTNSIDIYKNNTLYNKVGSSGFSPDNFLNLADICLGSDNMLYALDSFGKTIKRFDTHGRFYTQINIDNISSPTRFTISSYGDLFVYDSHAKEIYVLDSFTTAPKFTFAKFQVNYVENMFILGDYLHVYDDRDDKTTIFMLNGLLMDTYSGLTIYAMMPEDMPFALEYGLDVSEKTVRFPTSLKYNHIFFEKNHILFITPDNVTVYKL